MNSLVTVEGIITKVSNVRPKLVKSAQLSVVENKYTFRDFRDQTSLGVGNETLPTQVHLPTNDKDGNRLELEQGLCSFKDYQTVTLQEMPERSKVGQLPRSVEMILEYDLVDRVKPGDRAQCVGMYMPLSSVQDGRLQGVMRSILICNNVSIIGKEVGVVKFTGTDVKNIRY